MRISDWSSDVCSSDLCRRACWNVYCAAPRRRRASARRRDRNRIDHHTVLTPLRGGDLHMNRRDFIKTVDRKSTRLNSQSLMRISYAVFCLKKKKKNKLKPTTINVSTE